MTTTSAPRVPVARRPAGVAAAAGTTWTAQLASWLHTHATSIVVVSVALGAIAVVHAWGMATFPVRFDDEGTYVSQAWSLLTRGALSPYTYWYDHPPLGWMQLAGWFASTGALDRGGNAVTAGREAMLVAHLVSSGLLYVLARRLGFARGWSVVALVLYTASPLALSMHRMVFLDNLAMPWLIGAFVLACTPRHRLSAYAGAALCFAGAVLSKETFLLVLPALVYQMWRNTDAANRMYAWSLFWSVLVLTGLLYPVYALLRGELLTSPDRVSVIDAIAFQLGRTRGDSAETIRNWVQLDPWLLGLGAAAACVALFIPRLRPYALMAAIHGLIVLRPGYLPVPYVVAALMPASLLVAGAFDALSRAALPRARVGALPAVVSVLAALVLTALIGPTWVEGVRTAATHDQDAALRAAQRWVTANVEPDARLLVDNSLWLDLVAARFPERNVVWFYKLDLDPAGVGVAFPRGHRAFDYVIASEIVRDSAEDLPEIGAALDNSVTVATFGDREPVEVRRIHRGGVPARVTSDRQFVVDHYREFLDRAPRRDELTGWLHRLRTGTTHDEVIQALADAAYRREHR